MHVASGTATIPTCINPEVRNSMNAAGIALDTSVNVMITTMISIRILAVARTISQLSGSRRKQSSTYTSAVAILVESAAPCAIFGIMTCIMEFMFVDGSNSPFVYSFSAMNSVWSASIVSVLLFLVGSRSLKNFTTANITTAHYISHCTRKCLEKYNSFRVDAGSRYFKFGYRPSTIIQMRGQFFLCDVRSGSHVRSIIDCDRIRCKGTTNLLIYAHIRPILSFLFFLPSHELVNILLISFS
jgi:hypothetical protein